PNGKYMVERMHWLPQSYSRGSYTCYQPGQFTSIAGLEGEHAGLLKFAGEHADSFYEWQGFMEGAALSGVAAANQILYEIKKGNL
ncbi:MAG: FAD-dependent oxidoreductase, partial [Deltaproteobacteria bacterium]|nr:FAD-dependent oxidoreductase [Deltaproteobacteria bacterium]